MLKTGTAAAVGGVAFAAQANRAAAQPAGAQAGRKFRAFVAGPAGGSLQELKMLPLDENRVVVRTEACQACYTITNQTVRQIPEIPGHGGVGIVEAVGSQVRRVQVGDRVIVANTPYCGQCYMCLRGRTDRCQMLPGAGNPLRPRRQDGRRNQRGAAQQRGGFGELMIPYEWYCMPIFNIGLLGRTVDAGLRGRLRAGNHVWDRAGRAGLGCLRAGLRPAGIKRGARRPH